MDLKAYLDSRGVRLKGSGSNAHTACFFHGEESGKRGRLYINVAEGEEQGLHVCFVCGERGNLRTLLRHFGDEPEAVLDDSPHAKQLVLQDAAKFYADNLHPKVSEWLRTERGLLDETIVTHQIGWASSEDDTGLCRYLRSKGHAPPAMLATGLVIERGGHLRDWLSACVTIPYHVHGNVMLIRGKEMHGKYLTPPGQSTRLFNVDLTYEHEVLVLTEGELDALVLGQLGFAAVGVPGAKVWQENWNRNFDDVRRVHIMFDPDEAGLEGAIKIQGQLGAKARIVDLPVPLGHEAKEADPSFLVVKQEWGQSEFEAVINRSMATSNLLITVDEAFDEWSEIQNAGEGLKFGITLLDEAIRGGILPGQLVIPLAKTNVGKTMLLMNMFHLMLALDPTLKILFVSLEQTRGDWFEKARKIWAFYNLSCPLADVATGTLDFYRPSLELVDKNRVSEVELITAIEEYEVRKGSLPDLVAVDYLGYWAAGFRGKDKYEKVSDAVMSLKATAKGCKIPIIAPHQVNRSVQFGSEFEMDQARDAGSIEETADYIFALWMEDSRLGKNADEKTGQIDMKIVKSRSTGKDARIKFQHGKLCYVMVPVNDPVYSNMVHLARDETSYAAQGELWEQAIWRHRKGITRLGDRPPSLQELMKPRTSEAIDF